ncbi:hypothetical protein RU93_GL000134 [Enterococcus aquimarinus]|uniref:Uncharacterized protein n=1 Tax=Enterococcus aquimarinus TaxID=328396 RepID=A0A1L8QXJ5_9ENTE|nr:hypothetical protein RU93_GL000134 [Enterococcus aquimarinus]
MFFESKKTDVKKCYRLFTEKLSSHFINRHKKRIFVKKRLFFIAENEE